MEPTLKGKKIAVVGAGFTGLTAAAKLAEQGADITVYEACDSAGGLAGGCTLLDVRVEKAYHFLYKTDRHMIALLQELGIYDKLTYHKSSVSTYYNDVLYPMETPLDLIRFTPLTFLNRIRAGVTMLYLQKVKNWHPLTAVTAIEWLTKYTGRQVTKVIWEPLLRGKFDRYYDKVTMGWLWGRVKQRVESRDKKMGEALGYVEGGFATIIDRLIDRIVSHGGSVTFNMPVHSLSYSEESGQVNLSTVEGKTDVHDRVLVTTSCKNAAKMLEDYQAAAPDYFKKLSSIDYLDSAVLLFATHKPITSYYWHNINTPDSPFVVFLSLTSLIGTDRFNGSHVYYVGDYVPREHPYMSMEKEELAEVWFKALKTIFPEFDRTWVVEKQVFRFHDAQHIVDVGFEEKIVERTTPCPNVYLSNFSQIFPMDRGTNYAVRDGNQMAQLIASTFK